jgi:hypothetical protein
MRHTMFWRCLSNHAWVRVYDRLVFSRHFMPSLQILHWNLIYWSVVKSYNSSSCFDRLIDCLLFYVPLKNISLIWRRHHCRWRAEKFRPMLGAQGLWAGRDLYCATPAVTRDLGFSGLIRRSAPFSRLLRHAWECGGPILTRILTRRCNWFIFEGAMPPKHRKI